MPSLGKITTLEPEDLEVGSKKLNIAEAAITAVEQRGLRFPVPPSSGFKGEMPAELTSLDDEDLGDLLNNVGEWCGFVDKELATSAIHRASAQADLVFIQARIRIAIKSDDSKKVTVSDKDDMMETDPRVIEAKGKVLYTEAVYQLTKTIRDGAQRSWDTVSRRITQRGQAIERMKRETNVAGMKQQPSGFRRPTS